MSYPSNLKFKSSCCEPCFPCYVPNLQQPSGPCYCAEVEPIPQNCCEYVPAVRLIKDVTDTVPRLEQMQTFPLPIEIRDQSKFRCRYVKATPCITRRIKSCVTYNNLDCCRRNGIQDQTPQWYVLGRPFPRPGPGYRCCASYFPRNYWCC